MLEWKKLGDVCEVLDSQRKPVSKGKRTKGAYPYYGANGIQDYVDDYLFDGTFLLMGEDGSVINKDKSPVLHWAEGKIWVNNHAHILKGSDSALLRYLFYMLQCVDVTDIVRGVPPKINQANMRNILIPVPSLSEQTRIVGILDTFTASIENLKQQIAQRRKQYEHYRDQLLDLEGKEGVEMKRLVDLCDTLSGFPFDSSQFKEEGIQLMRGANVKRGYFEFSQDLNKYWDSSEGLEKYLLEPNDIIISMDGSLVGRSFCYLKNEYLPMLLVQRVARLRVKGNFKYVYYNIAKSFPDYVDKKKTAGAIPHISMKDINGFAIPVPSLPEQQRIVSILDTFEASIANLEQQLAQRERQYEYYRNKLLTFE